MEPIKFVDLCWPFPSWCVDDFCYQLIWLLLSIDMISLSCQPFIWFLHLHVICLFPCFFFDSPQNKNIGIVFRCNFCTLSRHITQTYVILVHTNRLNRNPHVIAARRMCWSWHNTSHTSHDSLNLTTHLVGHVLARLDSIYNQDNSFFTISIVKNYKMNKK